MIICNCELSYILQGISALMKSQVYNENRDQKGMYSKWLLSCISEILKAAVMFFFVTWFIGSAIHHEVLLAYNF